MVYSHCPRTIPRQIARPIKMVYIQLYESVHMHQGSVMPLATFGDFIGLATYFVLGVAQCEHTINDHYGVCMWVCSLVRHEQARHSADKHTLVFNQSRIKIFLNFCHLKLFQNSLFWVVYNKR